MPKLSCCSFPEDVLVPYFGKDANLVGVEIGVAGGVGSIVMMNTLLNLKLYCIDPWQHIANAPAEAGLPQEVQDEGYETTKVRLSYYNGRGVIIKKRSDDALEDVPNELDFIYIDGDHSKEQVTKDINNYLPKIKKGGLICGHDYLLAPHVAPVVNEIFKDKKINTADDFVWWVIVE